ncbi:MAG: tetratricopeptide repeat protein [Pseudomonadota bacterium]
MAYLSLDSAWEIPWQWINHDLPKLVGQLETDPGHSALLLGAAAGLALLWLLVRRQRRLARRRRLSAAPAPTVLDSYTASLAPASVLAPDADLAWDGPARAQPAEPLEAFDFDLDEGQPDSGAITVNEADPLAEASIFIMYGYHDRAAELLRWYLDDAGEAQAQVLQLLCDSYLKLRQVDDFADILERRLLLAGAEPALRDTLLEGLRLDPENLQLRVLAINYFGLDVDQINALLGLEPAAPESTAESRQPQTRPTPDPGVAGAAESSLPPPATQSGLVDGRMPLAPLSQTEKLIVRSFTPPGRAAKLHLAMGNHDEAVAALHRALTKQPNALVHFTELLKIHQARRDIDEYARTLWHLYAALGNAGQSLKERLLAQGFSLGPHPLFEALAQARERSQIEAIGRRFGFHVADTMPLPKTALVEVSGADKPALAREGNDILREVDSYLEFGQIDQAVKVLESAILADPAAIHLYPPLLELYERMDDLASLTELASGIKRRVQRPPEEVVAMMTSLFQRMKNRREQLAA